MGTKVTTRIAPSPTGSFHIGTARSALFNYLFAKKHQGDFIIRIEDTDKERSKSVYEKGILKSLAWLGLRADRQFRQSKHQKRHSECIEQLVNGGKAYVSKESAKERGGEIELVRFKNPNTTVTFTDLVRGEVSIDTTDLGDFAIARSTNDPLYHLAVVIDDHDEEVSHVIRGEEHLSNTPRQILIQEALGFSRPQYAHIPLILAPDRSKLSKRTGTATSVEEFQSRGFLPEALLNYLALLGWNPGTNQELFSLDELVAAFDVSQIQKGGAIFEEEKLRWFNKQYLQKCSRSEQMRLVEPFLPAIDAALLKKITPLVIERIEVPSDIKKLFEEGEFAYFFAEPEYETGALLWKGESDASKTAERLVQVEELLQSLEVFTAENVKAAVWDYAEQEGRGAVLWPMRFALSGKDKSPDPFSLADVLGKETTLNRIQKAIAKLEGDV